MNCTRCWMNAGRRLLATASGGALRGTSAVAFLVLLAAGCAGPRPGAGVGAPAGSAAERTAAVVSTAGHALEPGTDLSRLQIVVPGDRDGAVARDLAELLDGRRTLVLVGNGSWDYYTLAQLRTFQTAEPAFLDRGWRVAAVLATDPADIERVRSMAGARFAIATAHPDALRGLLGLEGPAPAFAEGAAGSTVPPAWFLVDAAGTLVTGGADADWRTRVAPDDFLYGWGSFRLP